MEHAPFDAGQRRTESKLRRRADGGTCFRVCKGDPAAVMEMCDNAFDVEEEVAARLEVGLVRAEPVF